MGSIAKYAWVLSASAVAAVALTLYWLAARTPPVPATLACAQGDASACLGLPRDDAHRDLLLIACSAGNDQACDAIPAAGAERLAALTRLCNLGVARRCREAAGLAPGPDAERLLGTACMLGDAHACVALSARLEKVDPVQAIGVMRSACLDDAQQCLGYGDRQAAAGAAEKAATAWGRACQAGVAEACSRKAP